ncbi:MULTISPECIES: DUF6628 family protein [unclassified Sphingomonas]|uniref:DUF6628 family protein n=2 Tax=Pseudomonadota TaxID=1224 RepID=UPI0009267BE9|nr:MULTISPECIES: DUF6628 family protein [unclassified Sphingomonas]OJU20014.1 MAG: hypothetical protein BGN95_21550 [Sphingomonas sp. 66-10]
MSLPATAPLAALPHPLPLCPNARALLFAMRRMGAHGLADARAAHAIFTLFREGFRRPLTLLRALMADLAASAAMPIAIAPCCCARMTTAEAGLLAAIGQVDTTPDKAALLLSDLLGLRRADGVLASVAALAAAFADEGRPIGV